MTLDELIRKLELLKSSTDVSGGDDIVINLNGEKFDIVIEVDSQSSDIFLELGEEV